MIVYVETSAAAKLLIAETETPAMQQLFESPGAELVSSVLLMTELRRLGWREQLSLADITLVLNCITIYEADTATFQRAATIPAPHLRTLDALHIAAAVRLGADAILSYDRRVQDAGAAAGCEVLAPV